jgi:hypothetical protein
MIVHYIEAHEYLPPPVFLDAVHAGRAVEVAGGDAWVRDVTTR